MPRKLLVPPASYSSSTTVSSSELNAIVRSQGDAAEIRIEASRTSTAESVAEGTCTLSGPELQAPIVRISPERMQRLERVKRVTDRPHGVRSPGGGRGGGAYSQNPANPRSNSQRRTRGRTSGDRTPVRRRRRPGTVVLKEIKHYQMTTELLIAKAPFVRVVRDVLSTISTAVHRMTLLSVEALQEASEAFLIHVLEDSYLCTIHAKRKTLMVQDVKIACRLRNGYNLN
uniref:Histone domain-containing protein n=1 Tax=Trichuris muris TaxID=70415 RepID=A0A5S6QQL1_TRIMR